MYAAPDSFDVLPPPPDPEFKDVQHFVGNCASLFRVARIQVVNSGGFVGRGDGDGGKRKRQLQGVGGKRRRSLVSASSSRSLERANTENLLNSPTPPPLRMTTLVGGGSDGGSWSGRRRWSLFRLVVRGGGGGGNH